MTTTIRVSISLTNYSSEKFVSDIFVILRALYRAIRWTYQRTAALSRSITETIRELLIGILLAEIVGLTLIFIAGAIFAIF